MRSCGILMGLKHECTQEDRIMRLEDSIIALSQRVASIEAKIVAASAMGGVASALVFKLIGG